MPNHQTESTIILDIVSIEKERAANKAERRQALDFCLNQRWTHVDIGRLERVDTETEAGWRMWRWRKDPS